MKNICPKINFKELQYGEILQAKDEYMAHNDGHWHQIDEFMIGSKVPECEQTKWRRLISISEEKKINFLGKFFKNKT